MKHDVTPSNPSPSETMPESQESINSKPQKTPAQGHEGH